MPGKHSRTKGHNWERKCAQMMRSAMIGTTWRRSQQGDGAKVPDLIGPIFSPECKIGRHWTPNAALEQAQENTEPGKYPVVFAKRDRKPAVAIMAIDDWMEIMSAYWREVKPQ